MAIEHVGRGRVDCGAASLAVTTTWLFGGFAHHVRPLVQCRLLARLDLGGESHERKRASWFRSPSPPGCLAPGASVWRLDSVCARCSLSTLRRPPGWPPDTTALSPTPCVLAARLGFFVSLRRAKREQSARCWRPAISRHKGRPMLRTTSSLLLIVRSLHSLHYTKWERTSST